MARMKEEIEALKDRLSEMNPEAILWDGFDDALIGIGERCGQPALAIYSFNKMVDILILRDGMTDYEAMEYIEVNVTGGWLGPHTPIALVEA